MKKYELIIDNGTTTYNYQGGCLHPKGLNIEFNIPHYDDASHVNLPTTITLYNADIELYFKNLSNFKAKSIRGAKVLLYAGWDFSGIFERSGIAGFTHYTTKFNHFNKYQNTDPSTYYGLIYMGEISAYLPNYSNLTKPSITIALTPITASSNIIGAHLAINGKVGTDQLKMWVKKFTNKKTEIRIDESLPPTINVTNSCILSAKNLNQALQKLRKIGVGSTRNKTNQLILFKAPTPNPKINNLQGINATKINVTAKKPKEIFSTQIIGIPRLENAVTMNVTVALNYDLKIGDLVYLDTKTIYKFALQNNNFANIISIVEIGGLQGGLFTLVGVEHRGEFRSKDPMKWATMLILVRSV